MESVTSKTFALAVPPGTYDLFTALTDLCVTRMGLYVSSAALGLSSVAIQTNTPTPHVILNAGEGKLSNLTAGKNVPTTWTQAQPFCIPAGYKMQATIVGTGTGGVLKVRVFYALGAFA